MPLIEPSPYRPPAYLWSGHLQTIIPSLFRHIPVRYVRERIETDDEDFLDLDWGLTNVPGDTITKPLVILSHGLEGDTTRQYIAGMVRQLTGLGFDCLTWHYRSCSGEMNRQARFYHIGETADLHAVIGQGLQKGYQTIYLVGFSMGGNITLKYLGERGALPNGPANAGLAPGGGETSNVPGLHPAIRRAAAISVPLDLLSSSARLEAWDSMLYNRRFQKTLKAKVTQKGGSLPPAIRAADLRQIRTLRQFDDLITAPLHGFEGVTDYYTRNSSLVFVPKITVPTLVLNARNDPFLSPECFPDALARELPHVWMEFPRQGGHCGFPAATGLRSPTYAEERVGQFFTRTID